MNKKTLNIILIVTVVALWGTVLYKYVNRFFNPIQNDFAVREFSSPISTKIAKDTFDLQPLHRDPFLDRSMIKRNEEKPIRVNTQPKVIKTKTPEIQKPFPLVHYYGYIKSQDKKEQLILLKVNNKLERVRLKSNIDGLIINQIYKDSIQVSYNKELKMIKKS
mgnify:FL=1